MPVILTFTGAVNEPGNHDVHIVKEKIVAFREDDNREDTRMIFTDFPVPFLVKETMEEIYNAISGNVNSDPTNDFV